MWFITLKFYSIIPTLKLIIFSVFLDSEDFKVKVLALFVMPLDLKCCPLVSLVMTLMPFLRRRPIAI